MIENTFKDTELGLIPQDWKIYSVGADCTVKARIGWQGLTTSEYLNSGEYGLITSTDIESSKINWNTCYFVKKERYIQDENIKVKNGDILISKDGTIGKVGIVENMPFPATLNSGVFVVRAKNKDFQKGFSLAFISPYFNNFIARLTAGSTIVHLYQKDIVNFKFPLPSSIEEQERIASALTSIDNLLSSLTSLIEKKKLIKQGGMQELLTGKKRLKGFDGEWKEVKIGDIAQVGRGRVISQKEIEASVVRIYPVYSSQTSNDGIMGYIDSFDFEGKYVTWTTDGVNAGTVFSREGKFNCTNVCGTLKFYDYDNVFMAYRLNMVTHLYVSTNLANPKLMNGVMKKIKLTTPPTLEEQQAISDILTSMDKDIKVLEAKRAKYENIKQGMMQQLLKGKIRLI